MTNEKIVAEAMANHDKHYWALVQGLKRKKKNAHNLADLIGEGSTVASAIWNKYENFDFTKPDPSGEPPQPRCPKCGSEALHFLHYRQESSSPWVTEVECHKLFGGCGYKAQILRGCELKNSGLSQFFGPSAHSGSAGKGPEECTCKKPDFQHAICPVHDTEAAAMMGLEPEGRAESAAEPGRCCENGRFGDDHECQKSKPAPVVSASPAPEVIQTLVYQRAGAWIAHCLELDIVATDDSKWRAVEKVSLLVNRQIEFAIRNHTEDRILFPAPKEYFDMLPKVAAAQPEVSASPAPKGEAMFFCGDCNAPYKLDGQAWPQMWYPTCLHKNPMVRQPSFAAAQPVAADPRDTVVYECGHSIEKEPNKHLGQTRWISNDKCPACKTANPKVEEAAKEIIRTLRPSDPGSWDANMPYVMARLESLGPFFTQVSQPPTDDGRRYCKHCTNRIYFDCVSDPRNPKWRHAGSNFVECFGDLDTRAEPAAPVTPVSGNGSEPRDKSSWKNVPIPPPKDYYKCFGCKAVFVDEESAEKHFGKAKAREYPVCADWADEVVRLKELQSLVEACWIPEAEEVKNELQRILSGAASHNGQGWVSARTKPEEDKNVLAIGPTWVEPIVCFWDGIGWTQYETSFDATSEVTHWQPLPAPPSEANGTRHNPSILDCREFQEPPKDE